MSSGVFYNGLPLVDPNDSTYKAAFAAASIVLPGTYTVDTLPDPAIYLDRYARVTDLFGVKRDTVLASKVGDFSFWQPVRPVFAAKQTVSVNLTLQTLKSPSVMLLDGNVPLGTNRTITLSNNLAFPGASFRIRQRNTLGSILGTLNVLNVNLGTPVSIITGGSQEFVWDIVDGWVQVT